MRWTKGFNCEGVEGRNVVELLQEALARRGDVQIEICAILNDTTGIMAKIVLIFFYSLSRKDAKNSILNILKYFHYHK